MPALTPFLRWATRFFLPNAIFTLFVVYLVLTYQQVTAQSGEKDSATNSPLVASTFAYQGFLTDAAGQPINGNHALTFRLYDVATGGTALWTEVRTTVGIEDGLFDVQLGELIPIPPSVWENPTLYLGAQVETEAELTPREPIGLVPVAQQALSGFPKLIGLDEGGPGNVEVTSVAGWNPVKGNSADDNIEVTLTTDASPLLAMMTARYTFYGGTPTGQYRYCAVEILEGGTAIRHYHLDGFEDGVNVFGCSGNIVITDLPAGTYTFRAVGLIEDAGVPVIWQVQRQIAVFDLPPIE